MIHPMWRQYPVLIPELEATQATIQAELLMRNKTLEGDLLKLMLAGGKLLRPAFFYLFSFFGNSEEEIAKHKMAAAIEVLHTASLVHDDMIDAADKRRGQVSIQAGYGLRDSGLAGDFLFSLYFKLLTQASDLPDLQHNVKAMRHLLQGELGQASYKYNTSLNVDAYLENVAGKTGALFALACREGARLGGSVEQLQGQAAEIGMNIGIAFQIVDDVLDYTETSLTLKKPVLTDMTQGTYSLPLILAIAADPDAIVPLLAKKEQMSKHDTKIVLKIIKETESIKQAKELARYYTELTKTDIAKLPHNQARDILEDLTSQLLERID